MENLMLAVEKNVANLATGFLPASEHVKDLYALALARSKLGRFLLGVYAFHTKIELNENLPMELLAEIAVILKADQHQATKHVTVGRMSA